MNDTDSIEGGLIMANILDRRSFLGGSLLGGWALFAGLDAASTAAAPGTAESGSKPRYGKLKKGVLLGMLPNNLSLEDRFKLARDVGFDGVEALTTPDPRTVEQIRKAADKAGIEIHSVMNSDHWRYPLTSDDPEVVAKSLKGMETSLRNAKDFGGTTVLLVPGVVTPKTRYIQAYERSQKQIRKLLPLAAELGIVIAIENVWNKFLLSPIEFARYVDEFQSPYLRAYFDVGNIVLYGYPQDWIRTLGKRIAKVHLKDFNSKTKQFVPLLEGSIDWAEVRKALAEIGYEGWVTAELPGGDEAYLREVSSRMDKIIAGG